MAQAETETEPEVRTGVFEELAQAVDDESLVAIISHPRRPVVAAEDVTGLPGQRPRCPPAPRDRQGCFLSPHRRRAPAPPPRSRCPALPRKECA